MQRLFLFSTHAVTLGASCGSLTSLRSLDVCCGYRSSGDWLDIVTTPSACTVRVQPGAIPAGLTKVLFRHCTLPELPPALGAAASSLRELHLKNCMVDSRPSVRVFSPNTPSMSGVLSQLTALTAVKLKQQSMQALPQQLAALPALAQLDLEMSHCADSQTSMDVLCSLHGLTSLHLSHALSWWSSADVSRVGHHALPRLQSLVVVSRGQHMHDLPLLAALPPAGLRCLATTAEMLLHSGNASYLQNMSGLENLVIAW